MDCSFQYCHSKSSKRSQESSSSGPYSRERRTGTQEILWVQPSVPFGALGVIFEEQAEGCEPKQEGLDNPQAAGGHVVDAFGAARDTE